MKDDNMRTFGELTKEEKLALFEAWLDGKKIAYYSHHSGCFLSVDEPAWAHTVSYRIAPPKIVKPSIDWSHVQIGFNYLFQFDGDADRLSYVSSHKPQKGPAGWMGFGPGYARAHVFASFKPGENCPWNASLVCRPGFE